MLFSDKNDTELLILIISFRNGVKKLICDSELSVPKYSLSISIFSGE